MGLPASLTCRRLAPWGLALRLGLTALSLPVGITAAQAAKAPSEVDLQSIAKDHKKARSFARNIAQGSPVSAKLSWPDVNAYLLAPRSASPVDYRNVLAEIGISPNQTASQSHAWLEALIELPPSRISAPLMPVFNDLLVSAGLMSWLTDQIRRSPKLRKDAIHTILVLADHHRGTFATGVDDTISRASLWMVPTLLLAQAGVYRPQLPARSQARLPAWIQMVKGNALRAHAPTRIRSPEAMHDFLLALTAISDPKLGEQLKAVLGAPHPEVRNIARIIARAIAQGDGEHREELHRRWRALGADPKKILLPRAKQQQALAKALGVTQPQRLLTELEQRIQSLDQERHQAWAQEIASALQGEHFDQLSALFAQRPGALVDRSQVQATIEAMDLYAEELLNRNRHQRSAELWARAHAIAQDYNLKNSAQLAKKRDNALLTVPDLSAHARHTLHRSLRPKAARIDDMHDKAQTPRWKGSALALFSVLLLPGAWIWLRRRA